eukprot:gene2105-3220_t
MMVTVEVVGVCGSVAVTDDVLDQLDTVADCAKDVARGWSGLRVRIGMHEGPVNLEYNSVMNRFDYFGPTVNVASRVEAVGVCGSVAVTDDVLNQVINAETPHFDAPFVAYEGSTKLKGVSESLHITFLAPGSLRVRQARIARMVEAKWAALAGGPSPGWEEAVAIDADDGTRLSDVESAGYSVGSPCLPGRVALDRVESATVGCVFLRAGPPTAAEDLNDSLARLL